MPNYVYDDVRQEYMPALYPGEKPDKWLLPDEIKSEVSRLNTIIETKYPREYLKICMFYNKLFPSLKYSNNIARATYNAQPFTSLEQESNDVGTGISANYLKNIIDKVVSRISTVSFDPQLLTDIPTLEYILYKEELERLIRRVIRNEDLCTLAVESFHHAAIVGYAHVIVNPWTGKLMKANDYEVGMFEPQFNKGHVKQCLFRDYAFTITELPDYLKNVDEETLNKLTDELSARQSCDLKLYFDCIDKKAYCTINNITLPAIDYKFNYVQIVTFCWDVGFSKVTSSSLFDVLFPMQREINKLNAKIQQLLRNYKGPVPVFNNDVDLSMKEITNGTGECLYVDSVRPIESLMTVINPTPLDPALTAEVTNYKTAMYELAGLQEVTFDMENMRSAAAVVALDQLRDNVFQNQLAGIGNFIKELFKQIILYNTVFDTASEGDIDWKDIYKLIDEAVIELKPVHLNDPLGNKASGGGAKPADYQQMQTARIVRDIIKGRLTFDTLPFTCRLNDVKMIAATTAVKYSALSIELPDTLEKFFIDAFIDDVKKGVVQL